MVMQVAALFVQDDGCYSDSALFDAWPESRDARKYNGDLPVIAHPPCQLWGKMARVNYARWGGEHNKPGNDGGCFKSALDSVNRCGGVLEHPAGSYAREAHGLKKPTANEWSKSGTGWVCEVWQSAYGHKANKATWLYFVGKEKPFDLDWRKPKGSHQIEFQDRRGKGRNKPTLNKREANATPLEFMRVLFLLAVFSRTGELNA